MSTDLRLGKYRLIAELGHGGMADVFLALVEGPAGSGFSKSAVVKRLRSNLAEDPEFVTMLIDEARITARLNHPNVVQMLEVGVVDEEYFLAMEYLDGQPYHRVVRRATRLGRALPASAHLAVIADVLAGLHHAHELTDYDGSALGIVHRDVTPQNVFVTFDGQVKVVDFGIAKAAGRAQETQHGVVKGKVRYMPPEQALGDPLDRRADIFAVGVLMWQALTGERFWGDVDDLSIAQRLITGNYDASPRAVRADVPEELDRICRRALARQADDRYETAAEMRSDIETFLGADALEGRRQLVATINDLFARERTELRSIVERSGRRALSLRPDFAAVPPAPASGGSIPAVARSLDNTTDRRIVTIDSVSPTSKPQRSVRFEPSRQSIVVASIAAAALSVLGVSALTSPPRAPQQVTARAVESDFVRLVLTDVRVRAHGGRAHDDSTTASRRTIAEPRQISATTSGSNPFGDLPPIGPLSTSASGSPTAHGRLHVDVVDPWAVGQGR